MNAANGHCMRVDGCDACGLRLNLPTNNPVLDPYVLLAHAMRRGG